MDGKVAKGQGTTPLEIFREFVAETGREKGIIKEAQIEMMAETVTDLDKWRGIVEKWTGSGWNQVNVYGMCKVYREGWDKDKNGNGKGDQSDEIDPDVAMWWKAAEPVFTEEDTVPMTREEIDALGF